MISTDKILFSLQMAEESLQEVQLLFRDGMTKSLLNSLYNVFYYGMEAALLNQNIISRNHAELKNNFIKKILQNHVFENEEISNSIGWEKEIETIFKMKDENDRGVQPSPREVQRLIQSGHLFLNRIKNQLRI